MKVSVKLAAILMALTCLLCCLGVFAVSAAPQSKDGDIRYTQKIVSVLFDNSGSMEQIQRKEYALYAVQMLMSLLDEKDILVITPMNETTTENGYPQVVPVTSINSGIEIDLTAEDRNTQIANALESSFFAKDVYDGKTPGSSIEVAVDQLEERGLKDRDNLSSMDENKEYWLVILTDGKFDEQEDGLGADDVIESHIKDFPSLKTIYMGLPGADKSIVNSELKDKVPFTPYITEEANQIVSAMQSVANQMSGRYTLDATRYDVDGSTVTVDLTGYEISFKSISVLAQNCDQTLVSAKWEGKDLKIERPCVIIPTDLNLKNGFSAVLPGDPYISSGTITLQFSGPVDANAFSILAEPALVIENYLEYNNGSAWERTTMQYINANLSRDDVIRVGYEVFEQANGTLIDIEELFGECQATVTYAGKSYEIGQDIPLVVGNNEIVVSVSVMDGKYVMYSSTICIIEEAPTYYRVEVEHDAEVSVADGKAHATYTVYSDNKPLTAEQLRTYTYGVNIQTPDGSPAHYTLTPDASGKINLVLNTTRGNYGEYKVDFTVTSEYNISRDASCTMGYYPKNIEIKGNNAERIPNNMTRVDTEFTVWIDGVQQNAQDLEKWPWELKVVAFDGSEVTHNCSVTSDGRLQDSFQIPASEYGLYRTEISITVAGKFTQTYTHETKKYPESVELNTVAPGSLSLSQHQLESNERTLAFEMYLDGKPAVLDNGITKFTLTVDGVDVSQYAVMDGNLLKYAPRSEHFGGTLSLGEKAVKVTLSCGDVSDTATATLVVTETAFTVVSVEHDKKTFDRFGLHGVDAVLYFQVLRDGVSLSLEELTAAVANGSLKVKDEKGTFTGQFWLPAGREIAVEELDGAPVVSFRVTRDWARPFHSFGAMLIFGNSHPVTASYSGASCTDSFTVPDSPAWSYIWRILVILFVIHCILYMIGFFNGKCRSHFSGYLVCVRVGSDSGRVTLKHQKMVNIKFKDKVLWHIIRFVPNKHGYLWYHQPTLDCANPVQIGFDKNGNFGLMFKRNNVYRIGVTMEGQVASDLSEMKSKLKKYNGKGRAPSMIALGSELRAALGKDMDAQPIPPKTRVGVGDMYGQYETIQGKETLTKVIFFVTRL